MKSPDLSEHICTHVFFTTHGTEKDFSILRVQTKVKKIPPREFVIFAQYVPICAFNNDDICYPPCIGSFTTYDFI